MRVFEILDAQVDVEESRSPQPLPDQPIELSFEGVHFKYPERPAILEQFNLTLEANRVTAIVGHTGAGKSTVANLAMRTYDVGGARSNSQASTSAKLSSMNYTIKSGTSPKTPSSLKEQYAIIFF